MDIDFRTFILSYSFTEVFEVEGYSKLSIFFRSHLLLDLTAKLYRQGQGGPASYQVPEEGCWNLETSIE